MRFLTFNLWHGLSPATPMAFEALEPGGRRALRERLQMHTLRDIAADICFLQEANPVTARARELGLALHMETRLQPDLVGVKLLGLGFPLNLNSGLVIAAQRKWGMRRISAVSLSRPGLRLVHSWGSWQLAEERFALLCEALLPGWGRVLLVNTHFHHGLEETPALAKELDTLVEELELPASTVSELKERLQRGNQRREQELSVLLQALESHERRYEAIVIAGDLNATPESQVCMRLAREGFIDLWAAARGAEPGLTFDAEKNEANHRLQARFPLSLVVEDLSFSVKIREALISLFRRQEARPRRIDYLWVRSRSRRLCVQRADLVGMPNAEGLAPSDHFGVCADVDMV
ncbi:MAG: endonuclease/exonuclease/phosphatase family protein [Bdellovibrionales bacterium]